MEHRDQQAWIARLGLRGQGLQGGAHARPLRGKTGRAEYGAWGVAVKVCVPVTSDGLVEPRWGKAHRVAVAEVEDDTVRGWQEFEVGWDALHDAGSEGSHHARIARFLLDQGVEAVAASHMGPPMAAMLERMGLRVQLGASGDAREAARLAVR